MPEKTLKEKVESGKEWLEKCAFNTSPGLDAIVALEARVEELERANRKLKNEKKYGWTGAKQDW